MEFLASYWWILLLILMIVLYKVILRILFGMVIIPEVLVNGNGGEANPMNGLLGLKLMEMIDATKKTESGDDAKKDNTKKEEALIANTNTVIEKTPEPATDNFTPANSTAAIKTIAIAKPKLRVVHINELESAPATNAEQVAISVHHEQNNFKFRFRNIHPVNQPAAPRQEYATLKIPLTN